MITILKMYYPYDKKKQNHIASYLLQKTFFSKEYKNKKIKSFKRIDDYY